VRKFAIAALSLMLVGCAQRAPIDWLATFDSVDMRLWRIEDSQRGKCVRRQGFRYVPAPKPGLVKAEKTFPNSEVQGAAIGTGLTQYEIDRIGGSIQRQVESEADPNVAYSATLSELDQQRYESALEGCRREASSKSVELRTTWVKLASSISNRLNEGTEKITNELDRRFADTWGTCMKKLGYRVTVPADVVTQIQYRISKANGDLKVLNSSVMEFDRGIWRAASSCNVDRVAAQQKLTANRRRVNFTPDEQTEYDALIRKLEALERVGRTGGSP
jgi:hypothetical protein